MSATLNPPLFALFSALFSPLNHRNIIGSSTGGGAESGITSSTALSQPLGLPWVIEYEGSRLHTQFPNVKITHRKAEHNLEKLAAPFRPAPFPRAMTEMPRCSWRVGPRFAGRAGNSAWGRWFRDLGTRPGLASRWRAGRTLRSPEAGYRSDAAHLPSPEEPPVPHSPWTRAHP